VGTFRGIIFGRAALCAVLAGGIALPGQAQAAASPATATAVTLRPLSIVKIGDLEFGRIIPGTTAGTVIIDPTTDGRTTTGGTVAAGGLVEAAQFFTYGGPLQSVQVNRGTLPTLNRSGGGATMAVTQLTLNGPTLRFLTAAGLLDLRVGGTLAVGANQQAGDYSGTFEIIVTYF